MTEKRSHYFIQLHALQNKKKIPISPFVPDPRYINYIHYNPILVYVDKI